MSLSINKKFNNTKNRYFIFKTKILIFIIKTKI